MLPPTRSLLLAFTALLLGCLAPVAGAGDRPNIIVILADDLGWGDLSCYGATALQTPHIDALAAQGMRFTSGYCSASTCTPTRYSLLTGTYAFRVPGTGIAPPNSPALIQPETPTLASLLKQAGYHTAVIGKWHLGLGARGTGPDWNGDLKPGPLEIGFDHCFLLPTTNDRVPQVFVEDHRVRHLDPSDPLWVGAEKPSEDHPTGLTHRDQLKLVWSHGHNATIHNGISRIGFYTGGQAARFRDEDLADHWVQESVRWIEQHREQPFFLLFSSHDIHVPRVPHERFAGNSTLGPRGDSILQLDWCVGQLVETLRRLNLDQRTLVVFCSDNGPVLDDGYVDEAIEKLGDHRPAGPFRGGKYNVFEGGTRTPLITWWPGRIQPGVSDEVVCTVDLSASLARLTEQTLPADGFLDSLDVLPAFLGEPNAQGRTSLLVQDNGQSGNLGYRQGKWKLVRHKTKRANNVNLRLVQTPMPEHQLFDLEQDPNESHDLSEQFPEITQRMIAELDELVRRGRSRGV